MLASCRWLRGFLVVFLAVKSNSIHPYVGQSVGLSVDNEIQLVQKVIKLLQMLVYVYLSTSLQQQKYIRPPTVPIIPYFLLLKKTQI